MRKSCGIFPLTNLILAACCAVSSVAIAQTAPVRVPNSKTRTHQEPCWEVAGISKSTMDQRRSLAQGTRSQVQSVCGDSTLTASQKREKIRQIREEAKMQEERLISQEQLQALHSCQTARGHSPTGVHPSGGHGTSGPCGELPANSMPSTGEGKKPNPESAPDN